MKRDNMGNDVITKRIGTKMYEIKNTNLIGVTGAKCIIPCLSEPAVDLHVAIYRKPLTLERYALWTAVANGYIIGTDLITLPNIARADVYTSTGTMAWVDEALDAAVESAGVMLLRAMTPDEVKGLSRQVEERQDMLLWAWERKQTVAHWTASRIRELTAEPDGAYRIGGVRA